MGSGGGAKASGVTLNLIHGISRKIPRKNAGRFDESENRMTTTFMPREHRCRRTRFPENVAVLVDGECSQ